MKSAILILTVAALCLTARFFSMQPISSTILIISHFAVL